jgi:predicted RecB family endonuclease
MVTHGVVLLAAAVLSDVMLVSTNTQERKEVLQENFEVFIKEVSKLKTERQNKEMMSITNGFG